MKFPSTSSQGNPLSNSTGTTTSITTTSTMAVDQVKKSNSERSINSYKSVKSDS